MWKREVFGMPIIILLLAALAVGLPILQHYFGLFDRGNLFHYGLRTVTQDPESQLRGKQILVLGSSVTMGMSAYGLSFVDYLNRKTGCRMVKDAVLASTLADRPPLSYVTRIRRHSKNTDDVDCFLCQLSTNDAVYHADLGRVGASRDPEKFALDTSVGGIEYIIDYVRREWNCPIIFYTGTKFDNPRYQKLVNMLLTLADKWDVQVIDLWHDEEMNAVTPEEYKLYMHDGVHPTRAGYRDWWGPRIEQELIRLLAPKA